jgi:hypothetical protein
MAAGNRVSVEFKSRLLRICKVVFYVASTVVNADDPVIKGIIALIERIVQGKGITSTIAISTGVSSTAGTGSYSTAEDRCLLSMQMTDGPASNFKIPGPAPSDFLTADKESIDAAGPNISGLVTAVMNHCVGQDGVSHYTGEVKGHRIETKRIKK